MASFVSNGDREISSLAPLFSDSLNPPKVQPSEPLQAAPLQGRVRTMEETSQLIKSAEESATKDKIFALQGGVGVIVLFILGLDSLYDSSYGDMPLIGSVMVLSCLTLGRLSWELWHRVSLLRSSLAE